MKRARYLFACGLVLAASATVFPTDARAQDPPPGIPAPPKPDFPPHTQVLAEFARINPSPDGVMPLMTLYKHRKDERVLAELSPAFPGQKYFLATTVAGGEAFAGLQTGDYYFYFRKYGTRLALIAPNVDVRSTGDNESRASVKRLFTDQILLETPILTMGPTGGPVVDLNSILVQSAPTFFGASGRFTNPSLVTVKKAKSFERNIEVSFEGPTLQSFDRFGHVTPTGTIKTLHYSLSVVTDNPAYQPRVADNRIGYFTTSYSDLGKYRDTETRVRYITRWHLQKRDPSLKLSPAVNPLEFYLEHTIPVRYRRWVAQGVLSWNKAFEKVGLLNAIIVHEQDAQTGRYMDIDPENVRYNFIRWLNNDVGTAIGPSRINPMTGEILDADIVLTDGWIRHFHAQYTEILPAVAMEGVSAETLAWLADKPRWDPRVRLAHPSRRNEVMARIRKESAQPLSGHPVGNVKTPNLMGDDLYDGLVGRSTQMNGLCMAGQGKSIDLALMAMHLALQDGEKKPEEKKEEKKEDKKPEEPLLDGMPESFIGPLLAELVAHEVGHTLGLRHNFKASSIYTFEEINSDAVKGKKPLAGSVMDYLPININAQDGKPQGDWSMTSIGPYDEWAIEYGYTFNDTKPVLARVNEPELVYGTDEEVGGPDPRAMRYDFSKHPIDYARNQMALVKKHRGRIVDKFVKDGESWARAREAFELSLMLQTRATTMMSSWLGGSFVTRSQKGDKDAGKPVAAVAVDRQREALRFVIENMFFDEAFGLSPDLLAHLSTDLWLDDDSFSSGEQVWSVHDNIAGLQATALTRLINPTTLRRIYDNELMIPADQDAVTLPEMLTTVTDALWQELKEVPQKQYTARVPMVSSLRRNLQQEHIGRLIDLSLPGQARVEADKPITNQASFELNRILENVNKVLGARDKLDPYTLAHLEKIKEQIEKLKAGQFIYNAADVGGGGGGALILLLGEEAAETAPKAPAE